MTDLTEVVILHQPNLMGLQAVFLMDRLKKLAKAHCVSPILTLWPKAVNSLAYYYLMIYIFHKIELINTNRFIITTQ